MSCAKEASDSILGYVCHELRNPLHAISASAAFLCEGLRETDEAYSDVHSIVVATENMHRIVNDVLDWNKLRAGKMVIQPHAFSIRWSGRALHGCASVCLSGIKWPEGCNDVNHVIAFVSGLVNELVDLHHRMVSPNVTLSCSLQLASTPDVLYMDSLRIRQVLSNGLTNAIKVRRRLLLAFPPETTAFSPATLSSWRCARKYQLSRYFMCNLSTRSKGQSRLWCRWRQWIW
jgi:signal transduction histidine kinase